MRLLFLVLFGCFSFASLFAQTSADQDALRDLPQKFQSAWSMHDGHALAEVMADDVDFITVGAAWLHGRADFEKYHSRLLSGRFKESTLTVLQTEIQFLTPVVAVVRCKWRMTQDKNVDGTPRPPRYGLMSMVAGKRKGKWLVVSSQNTNHASGTQPELDGITSPIQFPEDEKKQP